MGAEVATHDPLKPRKTHTPRFIKDFKINKNPSSRFQDSQRVFESKMADDDSDAVDRIYALYFQVMHYVSLVDFSSSLIAKMLEKGPHECTVADNEALMIAIAGLERLREEAVEECLELSQLMTKTHIIITSKEDYNDIVNLFQEDMDTALADSKALLGMRMEWLSTVKKGVLQHGKSEVVGRDEVKNHLPDIDSLLSDADQDSKDLADKDDDDQINKDSRLSDDDDQESKNSDSEDERDNRKVRTIEEIYGSSKEIEKLQMEEE